jgi:DNA-binding response OmpR family regulator
MFEAKILVVDDEPEVLQTLSAGLRLQNFDVLTATAGSAAVKMVETETPDLVVLDLMMPGGLSGLDVCRMLREWSNVPIIILSALGHERQKVAALDLGADDYLTKPFGMDELIARVRASLRRYRTTPRQQDAQSYTTSNLTIDYSRRVVTRAGEEIKLTPIEYDLLRYLSQHAERVVTHRQLLSSVWGAEYTEETQILRVHIGHLRRKIEDNPARPTIITTEPGIGYRLRTLDTPHLPAPDTFTESL